MGGVPTCGDAVGEAVRGRHRERRGVAVPPADRRLVGAMVPRGHVGEPRCPRPAVEVLVPAAHGEVDVVRVDVDRHGAGGVAQVPQGEGTDVVGGPGETRKVPQLPVRKSACDSATAATSSPCSSRTAGTSAGAGGDHPPADVLRDAGEHVQVGRERRGVGDHHPAARTQACRRPQGLEQVHGRRVADHHLARSRTDHPPDTVADTVREVPPAVAVPRGHQVRSPRRPRGRREAGGRVGNRTQRVAVEVDHVLRQGERAAQVRGFVRGVGRSGAHRRLRRHRASPSGSAADVRWSSVDRRRHQTIPSTVIGTPTSARRCGPRAPPRRMPA